MRLQKSPIARGKTAGVEQGYRRAWDFREDGMEEGENERDRTRKRMREERQGRMGRLTPRADDYIFLLEQTPESGSAPRLSAGLQKIQS